MFCRAAGMFLQYGEAVGSLVWDGTRAQLPLAMIKRHSETITTPGNT